MFWRFVEQTIRRPKTFSGRRCVIEINRYEEFSESEAPSAPRVGEFDELFVEVEQYREALKTIEALRAELGRVRP